MVFIGLPGFVFPVSGFSGFVLRYATFHYHVKCKSNVRSVISKAVLDSGSLMLFSASYIACAILLHK